MNKKYQTGSHHLKRKPFFNQRSELDIDVPDGDIQIGKRVYDKHCSGCHDLFINKTGPMLHNIFGKTAGTQKGFKHYSHINRQLGFQWSKERLYQLLENPQQVLGLLSNMLFDKLQDRYQRACLIEYLHHMRIHTSKLVKPEWINQQQQ